jgi:hypothetical protein
MNVIMVRSKMHEESVADVEKAIGELIQAIEEAQLGGVRYASCRLSDGVTFVALLEQENDGDNPLFALPAYAKLLANLKQWQPEPPTVEQMTVVGSYRLF